jgi:peptide deformylase
MRLEIVNVGELCLRASSRALAKEEIISGSIETLIDYMREMVRDAPGGRPRRTTSRRVIAIGGD